MERRREWAMAEYAAASIRLYSLLWRELEALSSHLSVTTSEDGGTAVDMELVMFRLELALLLDACDGTRWQSLLLPEQRLILRTTLEQLLDTLSVPSDALGLDNVSLAQNQLYDAVLGQCDAIIHQPQVRAVHPATLPDHADALTEHPATLPSQVDALTDRSDTPRDRSEPPRDHSDMPTDHSDTLPAAAAFWSNRSRSPSAACRRRIGSPINS